MKKIALLSVLCFWILEVRSQDTLTVMTYNLLAYGSSDHSSLAPSAKNPHLKTIINQILPDIFGANEISSNVLYADNILANVLNQDGRNYYKRANYSNQTNSEFINMLFYNSNKLGLSNQYFINGGIRDMFLYKLYYKDPNQNPIVDTTFLYVVLVHLKAGNTASDIADRNTETQSVMNFLNNFNFPSNANLLIMGDMNLYTSSEVAYQNLTSHSNLTIRFQDPIQRAGGWSGDPNFQDIHTQSTRINTELDGGSGGGLDDRFDHILMNQNLLNGSHRMQYIPNSYQTFGNDGNHFNAAINVSNTAVSQAVANALYAMSDHLPVVAKIKIYSTASRTVSHSDEALDWVITPSYVSISSPNMLNGTLVLYDLLGNTLYSQELHQNAFTLDTNFLRAGVYFLKWEGSTSVQVRKMMKF